MTTPGQPFPPVGPLQAVVEEIERYAASAGWDNPPRLFALVDTASLLAAEPDLAGRLGIDGRNLTPGALTPVEQESIADEPLDEVLGRIAWPATVTGCALVHEALVLPPAVEDQMPDDVDPAQWAAEHPERREIRMAVAVLRDGATASALRLRPEDGDSDPDGGEVAFGRDLAPNLAAALLSTLDSQDD
jgi:hypothetical protein